MHGYDADLPAHIHRRLMSFIASAADPVRRSEPTFTSMSDTLANFVLGGGKRLRPTFAWWAWRGTSEEATSEHAEGVLQAVSSLELIQACALIHDDLMDSSDSRRGYPTVHVAFAKSHTDNGWLGSPTTFGLAAAVLIGDLALAWADDMFAAAPLPADWLARARPAWQAMRTEVLAGQYLDVHTQATGDSSTEVALRIDKLKTAAYTVARPLHLGAALAGASAATITALHDFGSDIGVAFQLRDDLLGVFGDPSITGKPAGDDLREGKRTLLLALGIDHANRIGNATARTVLTSSVGNPELTEHDVVAAQNVLTDVGAVEAIEQRIDELTTTALDYLRRAELAEPAATELADLACRATQRTY